MALISRTRREFGDAGNQGELFAALAARSRPWCTTSLEKVVDDEGLAQVKSDDTYPPVLRRFLGDLAGQALKDVGGR
ncbi:MAG: hypothetical protein M3P85_00990 [Actinomycetota bacterium]|nr:hypothetical protein [Actinomycetota bacterium]